METSNKEALLKWGALALGVIALECIGTESLTYYAHKGMEHPIGRWIIPAAIGITAMHLMDRDHDILPESIDAYHVIAKRLDRRVRILENVLELPNGSGSSANNIPVKLR